MVLLEGVHQTAVFFHNVVCGSSRFCFPRPMSAVKLFLVKNAHDVAHQMPIQPNDAIDKIFHSSFNLMVHSSAVGIAPSNCSQFSRWMVVQPLHYRLVILRRYTRLTTHCSSHVVGCSGLFCRWFGHSSLTLQISTLGRICRLYMPRLCVVEIARLVDSLRPIVARLFFGSVSLS